jgi:hypothetical protein
VTARIVLHSGAPKAGSSSVQRWVEANAAFVRAHGVEPMQCKVEDRKTVVLRSYQRLGMSSGQLVKTYVRDDKPDLMVQFGALLADAASRHETVLVSCEAFGNLLADGDAGFLGPLEELASTVSIQAAYYVRPQHAKMEAAWKQWGFRTGVDPSTYLRRNIGRLDYERTPAAVAATAPGVDVVVRPFRTDLLDKGNIVVDFASRFLGIDELPDGTSEWWSNRGLPLDMANLMRYAPADEFYSGLGTDKRYNRLKRVVGGWDVPDSPTAEFSRLVLRAWCFERFEQGNRELIDAMAWPTDHFIPPLTDDEQALLDHNEPTLEALDQLWEPSASPTERDLFYASLRDAVRRVRRGELAPKSRLRQVRRRLRRLGRNRA